MQAQYKRMVQQEYNRLNKLVTIHVQCEPSVQDLAIQTEFVAPPVIIILLPFGFTGVRSCSFVAQPRTIQTPLHFRSSFYFLKAFLCTNCVCINIVT